MKRWKIALLAILLVTSLAVFAGCEHKTGNRITGGKDVQGAVTQWRDYDNSDVVQVLVDGKYFLTHYTNVVLVADPNQGALTYSDVSYGWDPVNE